MIHFSNGVESTDADDFVTITVNEFTDDSGKSFEEGINKAHTTDQPIIPVRISSNGGRIDACMQMKSAIDRSELPVLTYTPDRAYSCGFALLAFGTDGYRFVDPHAFTMDHQGSYVAFGKDAEIENTVEFRRQYLDQFYEILAEECGQDPDFFKDRWENMNNLNDWLDAQETLKIGAADQIGKPKVKAEMKLEWNVVR